MTTPLDIMLGCKHCDEQVPPYDTADRNYKAWQCPHCKGWNNWMKYTVETNEVIEPITPQGNISDMGKAILAQAKALGIKVVEVDPKDLMGYLTSPSNSKYNVSDMQGNPIPDEVVAGNLPPWYRPDDKPSTEGRWDLRDEDGDYHSPAWYLDAFITARETYQETREKVANCEDDRFDKLLDDVFLELDRYSNYINRLFGSKATEGNWHVEDGEGE